MLAADVPASLGGPYPAPPDDGTWQRGPGITTGPGVDGPQWILEHWGDLNGVFQFLRIEDIAYDKRPGMSNVVYLADSGRGSTSPVGPGVSTNGRIWKMVLDEDDPTEVDVAVDPDRGRRQPGEDPLRGPPAGQPREHGDRPAHHRGSGQQPAVRAPPIRVSRMRPRHG